jgi:predicted ArsR family transcriptional regulator
MQTGICINRVKAYNKHMKSTRQQITEYLSHRQRASAVDMSRALHLTAADIRHHLAILEAEGVVTITSQRPASGRGRPTSLYQLTSQAASNNFDALSSALLAETRRSVPELEQTAFHKRLAQRLAGDNYLPVRNPSQRYVNAVKQLNQMKYEARWEARADAPQVIFSHCPYAAILPGHPELCQMDAELLEVLLAIPISQTAKQQPNPRGIPQCLFIEKKS